MKSSVVQVSLVYSLICVSVHRERGDFPNSPTCHRAQSALVRQILHKIWRPIFNEYSLKLPKECPLHFSRDIYKYAELAKLHYRVNLWTCGFCGKSFFKEPQLDHHIANRHAHHVHEGDETVCLADYCDVFRCRGFELEEDPLLNDTQEKKGRNSQNKALVLGPPSELAVLLSAREEEKRSEAFIGLSETAPEPGPSSTKKRKDDKAQKEERKTFSSIQDTNTKKRSSSIIDNLDPRSPEDDDDNGVQESLAHWLFKTPDDDTCDNNAMEEIHTKCQNLIHDCISPLLSRLSSEEYIQINKYLDRRMCWYLTCERYWKFMGSKRPGSSLVLLIVLGTSLLAFLVLSYYVVWFCF